MQHTRIETFVDWFIRSEFVADLTSDRDNDVINYSDRANRCYEAAEFGCDGKTHSEVIGDWRDAFADWLRSNHRNHNAGRFVEAVESHFDRVETWHSDNGSLFEQAG
jgi:hypothetical protein